MQTQLLASLHLCTCSNTLFKESTFDYFPRNVVAEQQTF